MRGFPAGHSAVPIVAHRGVGRGRLLVLALAGIVAGASISGCDVLEEHVCRGGEYPVKPIGSATGGQCVADDKDPPPGTVRYPAGKVPRTVDDKWDKHWRRTIFDANGNPVGEDPSSR